MSGRLRLKFGKPFHLKSKKEIRNIFKHGKKRAQSYIIIYYSYADKFRFAVSFKRKLFGSVQRNYFKRRIKEFIRLNQHLLKDISCVIVVIKNPSSYRILFRELSFLVK